MSMFVLTHYRASTIGDKMGTTLLGGFSPWVYNIV